MAKFGLIKWAGKALGCIALPLACALFATYAKHHLPGWAFALSLLLVVAGSVPAVLFFNLFRDNRSQAPGKRFEFDEKTTNDWTGMFSPWRRDEDDRN